MARSYESNGPEIKVRGNAAHVAEKYTILARDALSSGDTVAAENYFQHAEHYNRIVAAAQAQYQQSQPTQPGGGGDGDDEYGSTDGDVRHQPDRPNGGAYQAADDDDGGTDDDERGRRVTRRARQDSDGDGAPVARPASGGEKPKPEGEGRRQRRPARAAEQAPNGGDASESETGEEDTTRDGTAALAAFPD